MRAAATTRAAAIQGPARSPPPRPRRLPRRPSFQPGFTPKRRPPDPGEPPLFLCPPGPKFRGFVSEEWFCGAQTGDAAMCPCCGNQTVEKRRSGVIGTAFKLLLLYVVLVFASGTLINTGHPVAVEAGR